MQECRKPIPGPYEKVSTRGGTFFCIGIICCLFWTWKNFAKMEIKYKIHKSGHFQEIEIPFPNQKKGGKIVGAGKKIVRATSTTTAKGTCVANSPSSVCESAAAILGYFHNATVQGARI